MPKRFSLSADAYLAAIVDSSDDAIFSEDLAGVIRSWNSAAERLFGVSSSDAIGEPMDIFVPSELRAEHDAVLARVVGGETVRHFDTIRKRKDGTRLEVSLTVSPIVSAERVIIGVSNIARELSERRHAELAALRLAAIVQSSDDAIISKDLNGIVTSWNPAAERIFGFTADEMIGQSILRIIPKERWPEETYVLSRLRAGLGVDHYETVRMRNDGTPIDISLTVSPVRNAAGVIVGASKIARDITEWKRLEQLRREAAEQVELTRRRELEEQNRRMQEANRLKSEFVANMSHELRTPLNAIIGFAELLFSGKVGRLAPKHREFVGAILKSGRHLMQLIDDVLDLAKVDAGRIDFRPEPVDVEKLVTEVRDIVGGLAAARKTELRASVDPAVSNVFIDPARFKQVLYNYLSNAIKFTPDRGRVTIRVSPEGGSHFRVEVEDTGIGIKPEEMHRLFIEFQQLDSSTSKAYPGTGLGLALTKRIVEAQGGSVGVQSTPGSGSTFFAVLPREVPAFAADAAAHSRTKRAEDAEDAEDAEKIKVPQRPPRSLR